jgi:hypothetical protein
MSQNRTGRGHLFAKVRECAACCAKGEAKMSGLLIEILLFSCVGAFFTGIVLAAASLLG